jgi:hypothetical protein
LQNLWAKKSRKISDLILGKQIFNLKQSSNIVAPFLTKVKRIEHSELIELEDEDFTGGLSRDILFYNEKGSG